MLCPKCNREISSDDTRVYIGHDNQIRHIACAKKKDIDKEAREKETTEKIRFMFDDPDQSITVSIHDTHVMNHAKQLGLVDSIRFGDDDVICFTHPIQSGTRFVLAGYQIKNTFWILTAEGKKEWYGKEQNDG
jgi:hypothetical protein